jgi:uncharacterized protein YigE (DUF2233 family)
MTRAACWAAAAAAMLAGCRQPAPSGERTSSAPQNGEAAPATLGTAAGVEIMRSERVDSAGHQTVWVVVRADLSRTRLQVQRPRHARLENFESDRGVLAAINGGFFDADESPSGWLVSDGVTLSQPTRGGGSGFIVIAGGRARLLENGQGTAPPVDVELAVQCGPRLIEPGGRIGMRGDDGKRAARTALCVRRDGQELDFTLAWTRNSDRDGPTLFQMAAWLAGPVVSGDASGCEAALNLDGGPSTGLYLRDQPELAHRSFGRVPFALVLRAAP